MPFPQVEPARPPALNDDILKVMRQTVRDFHHGNADPAALEHVLYSGEAIIDEVLAWRAAAKAGTHSVQSPVQAARACCGGWA